MEIQTAYKKRGRPRKKQPSAPSLGQITVHLPPELVSALDNELIFLGMRSRSELIREACQAYLTQHKDRVETLSLTQRMRTLSKEERQQIMASAAETLGDYYRTDPEILEWHALDGEEFLEEGLTDAAD